mmetsp:Transcript_35603/g.32080  ORF Transcript_35603/g.32080 Transcript_35603/m.32080 type:complete len:165 (-) Transcript_35603:102-596(-)
MEKQTQQIRRNPESKSTFVGCLMCINLIFLIIHFIGAMFLSGAEGGAQVFFIFSLICLLLALVIIGLGCAGTPKFQKINLFLLTAFLVMGIVNFSLMMVVGAALENVDCEENDTCDGIKNTIRTIYWGYAAISSIGIILMPVIMFIKSIKQYKKNKNTQVEQAH